MNREKAAIGAILFAGLLNALVGAGFYFAYHHEAGISAMAGVYVRVICNLFLVPLPWMLGRPGPQRKNFLEPILWLWGGFGVLSAGSYYLALLKMGSGMTMFLNTGSGLFIAGLAPWIAGQALDRRNLIAIFGCLVGMSFIAGPSLNQTTSIWDIGLGIGSGLFAAIAYLIVARMRSRFSADTLLLHWTFANILVMGIVLLCIPTEWPSRVETWAILFISGIAAAGSQYMTATAYQLGQASIVACLSFLGPLLSVLTDMWLFEVELSQLAWVGVMAVTLCGMVLPFMRVPKFKTDPLTVHNSLDRSMP